MEQLVDDINFEKFEKQQFSSLAEQFECYQETIEIYLERQQFTELSNFLLYCSEHLITSEYVEELIYYYYELLPKVQKQCPKILDMMHMVLGHCYVLNGNYEEAKSCYYLATSHAMETDNYQVLSLTLNNLNTIEFGQVPAEITFEKSTLPSVFFLMMESRDEQIMLIRLIGHIELAIELKHIDYAYQMYERHFSASPFEKHSRHDIQIQGLKGTILYERACYEEALQQFHECFMICVSRKVHHDLIVDFYLNITSCYEKLGRTMHLEQLKKTKDTIDQELSFQLPSAKKMLQQVNPSMYSDEYFTDDLKSFERQAKEHFQNCGDSGSSLIVVDLEMKSEFHESLESFVQFIHEQMQATFSQHLVLSTRMDRTRLGYIVPLAESECDALIDTLSQQITEQFSGEKKVYETVYLTSINNVERGLTSYKQCRDFANALIYYELYK